MTFVPFERPGEQFSSRVSIWKTGILAISAGAVRRFGLEGASHCQLFFDKERPRVGLRFVSGSDLGALKIHWRASGFVVPAKSFMVRHDIDCSVAKQYLLSSSEGMLHFDLRAPLSGQEDDSSFHVEEAAAGLELFLCRSSLVPRSVEARASLVRFLFQQAASCKMDRWQLCDALLSAVGTEEKDCFFAFRQNIEAHLRPSPCPSDPAFCSRSGP